jgi:hypothetical protein
VAANVVPSLSILVTLMREALSSSETSVFTRIPEDAIPHSHRRENLKSLIVLGLMRTFLMFITVPIHNMGVKGIEIIIA